MRAPYGKGLLSVYWIMLGLLQPLAAQKPVQAFSTAYTVAPTGVIAYAGTPASNAVGFSGCAGQGANYIFQKGAENALLLISVLVNGRHYFSAHPAPPIIKLRRVNNAEVAGNRSILFLESAIAPAVSCPPDQLYSFKSPYQDDMEVALSTNYVNQGTDNIFANTGNEHGNNNNIERIDVLFPQGISAAATGEAGFVVLERGNNTTHDAFRIAAVTALDPSGNPAAFGPLRTCMPGNGTYNGSWGHPALEDGNHNLSVYVMRKEETEGQLQASAAINQQLGAVFFSLHDLGVAANQVIYGYALLAADGMENPTSEQLLNLTDANVYPLNTNDVMGGGLDLVAVNGFFQTATTLKGYEVHLKGSWQGEKAVLQWTLKEWPANSYAELQGSADGNDFSTVQTFVVPGSYYANSYTAVQEGVTYYRLKVQSPQGEVVHSNIIQVKGTYRAVQIYPTQIQRSQPVRLKGIQDGTYTVILTSASGETYVASVNVQNGTGLINPPPGGYATGFYYVLVRGANDTEGGAKLIVY